MSEGSIPALASASPRFPSPLPASTRRRLAILPSGRRRLALAPPRARSASSHPPPGSAAGAAPFLSPGRPPFSTSPHRASPSPFPVARARSTSHPTSTPLASNPRRSTSTGRRAASPVPLHRRRWRRPSCLLPRAPPGEDPSAQRRPRAEHRCTRPPLLFELQGSLHGRRLRCPRASLHRSPRPPLCVVSAVELLRDLRA